MPGSRAPRHVVRGGTSMRTVRVIGSTHAGSERAAAARSTRQSASALGFVAIRSTRAIGCGDSRDRRRDRRPVAGSAIVGSIRSQVRRIDRLRPASRSTGSTFRDRVATGSVGRFRDERRSAAASTNRSGDRLAATGIGDRFRSASAAIGLERFRIDRDPAIAGAGSTIGAATGSAASVVPRIGCRDAAVGADRFERRHGSARRCVSVGFDGSATRLRHAIAGARLAARRLGSRRARHRRRLGVGRGHRLGIVAATSRADRAAGSATPRSAALERAISGDRLGSGFAALTSATGSTRWSARTRPGARAAR